MFRLSSTSLPWYRPDRPPHALGGARGSPTCIQEALAAAAQAAPHRALLVDREGYLTQSELLDAVERRARRLLKDAGGAERTVGVRLAPGIEMVTTYFACVAAGLRYLPLPVGPLPWVDRLLQALPVSVLVVHADAPAPSGIETLRLGGAAGDEKDRTQAADILPPPDPRRIAHVLPTSGTETGVPKAVMTDHVGSMLSHEWRFALWPAAPARDVVGCNLFGIWDVVPSLCRGVPAVMLEDGVLREPEALASSIVRYEITRLMLTPTLLDACLADDEAIGALRRLRRIVLCGEPVSREVAARAREALPGVALGNLYSLSECHDVAGGDLAAEGPVTAGRVARFADVHIVDPDDRERLVPVGVPGRVLIGGRALAAGYVDPAATAERFFDAVLVPGASPQRVYDSGDLGVLHGDGRLEILGRVDAALKVRGGWAEPDAVARLLREHPRVAQAAVVPDALAQGGVRLVAFVVPRAARDAAQSDLAASLRGWLGARAGPHGVPARVCLVDRLPVSAAGKIDVRRLQEAAASGSRGRATDARAPGRGVEPGALERVVLETFREVLDAPDADLDDDLDTLGADSLALIVLLAVLRRRTGRNVRLAELRHHRTPRALARRLGRSDVRAARAGCALPALELDVRAPPPAARAARPRRVLVTGATGALGRALIDRLLDAPGIESVALVRARSTAHARERLGLGPNAGSRVEPIAGDLALPRFGLAPAHFSRLAARIDAVLHTGADLDMFADEAALEPVNVGGTREVLRLAFEGGARVVHVSSSAVLPLDPDREWDETSFGVGFARAVAPGLARSDGYSRSKLAAEALVWQAAEQGLEATAVRLPHLLGAGVDTRLAATLRVLAAAGVLPEGEWQWQVAPVEAVCTRLVARLAAAEQPPPLEHLVAPPIRAADVEEAWRARRAPIRLLSWPALGHALAQACFQEARTRRAAAALEQLIAEHGPRAALSLADARLAAAVPLEGAPRSMLDALL